MSLGKNPMNVGHGLRFEYPPADHTLPSETATEYEQIAAMECMACGSKEHPMENCPDAPNAPSVSSDKDRADEGVRLREHERQILRVARHEGLGEPIYRAVERILAARLAEVEQERDRWKTLANARRKARVLLRRERARADALASEIEALLRSPDGMREWSNQGRSGETPVIDVHRLRAALDRARGRDGAS